MSLRHRSPQQQRLQLIPVVTRQLFSSLCLCPRPVCLSGTGQSQQTDVYRWFRHAGATRSKEKKGRAPVPRILCGCPPLFSATCIQYCQTDCKARLSRPRPIAREWRAEWRRETRRKGAASIVSAASTILLPSHLFPSLPSCCCGITGPD